MGLLHFLGSGVHLAPQLSSVSVRILGTVPYSMDALAYMHVVLIILSTSIHNDAMAPCYLILPARQTTDRYTVPNPKNISWNRQNEKVLFLAW